MSSFNHFASCKGDNANETHLVIESERKFLVRRKDNKVLRKIEKDLIFLKIISDFHRRDVSEKELFK